MTIQTKYRTCNLCEALCGLEIETQDNQVVSIRGDKKDVFSKGHICPKAVALKDLHEDPNRLKYPMERKGDSWTRISWEDAFAKAAAGLYAIQKKHGPNALGIYQGNPSAHNIGTILFSPQFVRLIKTKNRYSATSVDQLAHHMAGEFMLGHMNLVPVPDINRTSYWFILGGNPLVSNGSLMTAPDVSGKLKAIQKRGGKVVVVDPRKTETANKADQHLFVKPATDIWLLLAMINLIIRKDKMKLDRVQQFIELEKIEDIKEAVRDITPEVASVITGIPAESIETLVDEFTAAESAVCYGRLGVSATEHGALSHWAINVINVLTGNFDSPGGAMLSSPAINLAQRKNKNKRLGRWHSRVRKLPEYGGELPSSTIAEDILTPGEDQIKGFITSCGNPVLSVPNGRKIEEAFSSLDFMVSVDIFINETTKHANIILPPATGLETPHYGAPFHNLAVHNTAKYSPAAVEKEEGTKYDWEIFNGLVTAYNELLDNPQEIQAFTLEQTLGFALMSSTQGITLSQLKDHPHGIDLGPLESKLPEGVLLDTKKMDILPKVYHDALRNLIDTIEDKRTDKRLLLIGRRHLRSNNSWLHNSYRMVKGRERCTALIHPDDAKGQHIENGDVVTVTSRVGSIQILAELTDEMMPGAISIPHGWGHHRDGIQLDIAAAHAGVSINDIIDDELVDELCGVSVINATPVTIERASV